jgi:uncharacterized protein YbcI
VHQSPGIPGEALTTISTAVVQVFREHYGRGPTKAKTYVYDDLVICVLRDVGLTPVEKAMAGAEEGEVGRARTRGLRRAMHTVIRPYATEVIEELTGRRVQTLLADSSIEPDVTVLTFLMDGVVGGELPGRG